MIPAGAAFSFWRQVGPPLAARGFVPGRMLKQGCLMPVVGGGLCQLSNALYQAALGAGCEITERHAHSRIIPGSHAAAGRDATVAWNYVDLRFAPTRTLRLTARLDEDRLCVKLTGEPAADRIRALKTLAPIASARASIAARSCGSCGETDCFMHRREAGRSPVVQERAAFLVDQAWPEFRDHVASERRPVDWLGSPYGANAGQVERYSWSADGFERTFGAPVQALSRSLAVRRAAEGAARRRVELASGQAIAERLARRLTQDVTAVTVAQSYLPFLWLGGHLGGRRVSVLMTRLPSALLQQRLGAAFAEHPDRRTLADFRAPDWLVEAETEALASAARIVTPHAEIAALFGPRAVHLPWRAPALRPPVRRPVRRIAFPGPTAARKGAYAVREAARALDLEVMPLGAELEGDGFWDGVRTLAPGDWAGVDAFVQPALAEEQPRRLLAALAAGIPVFASAACGLAPCPGLTLVRADDPADLIAALAER